MANASKLKKLLQSIAHIIEPNNVDAEITVNSRCPENDTHLHTFVWRNELEIESSLDSATPN